LRSFTWGNVLQLQKVHRRVLAELARRVPLLPGADVLAFVDVDSQQKRVYGHAKQGAAFGFTKIQGKGLLVRGLNVLAAAICTPLAAPVIAGTRLRGGNAASARGAASMVTEAVATARAAGCTATIVVRMDSAFYGAPACAATRRAAACFSVTVRMDPDDFAMAPIDFPGVEYDADGRLIGRMQQAKAAAHLVDAIRGQGYEIAFEDPATDVTEAMRRILWDRWSEDEIGEHQFIGRLFDDRGQIYRGCTAFEAARYTLQRLAALGGELLSVHEP
jgi:hypothetical protein